MTPSTSSPSFLAKRASAIKGSPTLALVGIAKGLIAKGHDVISLTVGEPDWNTFPAVSQAGIEAIQKNYTKYTAANGSVELRNQIAKQTTKDLGLEFDANNISVGPGAKFVLYAAFYTLLDEGDECLLFSPYWVSYPSMIELAGGKSRILTTTAETNFKLLAADLDKAITPKTKAFLFCSPSNPTGMAYTEQELKDIAEVLRKHPQVVVLSDDMYNHLMFSTNKIAPHLLHVAPDLANRVISFNGGSKTYSMTGWRIGWAVGPKEIVKAIGDFQSQALGAPSSIAQYALEKTLVECEPEIHKVNVMLNQRMVKAMENFKSIPQFKVYKPEGAFYLWIDVSAVIGKSYDGKVITDSKTLSEVLLYQLFVATVPGIECGSENFMRLSFAINEDRMAEAIQRMKKFVDALV